MSPLGGFLIQSRGGQTGDFEVVIPWPGGGLAHFFRDNDNNGAWNGPGLFGTGTYTGATLIESDFRLDPEKRLGSWEVLASRADGVVEAYWRDNLNYLWHGPSPIVSRSGQAFAGVGGVPSMAYSGAFFRASGTGHNFSNFLVVAPDLFGGFKYWQRANQSFPDGSDNIFWGDLGGAGSRKLVGVGIISPSMGSTHHGDISDTGYADVGPGLERIVAGVTAGGQLELHVRWITDASGLHVDWIDQTTLGEDVYPELDGEFWGRPCLVQGDNGWEPEGDLPFDIGHFGDLELVAPSKNGGILYMSRDCGNRQDGFLSIGEASRWRPPLRIPGPFYDEVSLIQSNFGGENGNLELIARRSHQRGFDFYYRDENRTWHGPQRIGEHLIIDRPWEHRRFNVAGDPVGVGAEMRLGAKLVSWVDTVNRIEHIAWNDEGLSALRRRLGSRIWSRETPQFAPAERYTGLSGWFVPQENSDYIAYHGPTTLGDQLYVCRKPADSTTWELVATLGSEVTQSSLYWRTGPIGWIDYGTVVHIVYASKGGKIHEWFRRAGTNEPWQHSDVNLQNHMKILDGTIPSLWVSHSKELSSLVYFGADGRLHHSDHRVVAASPRWDHRLVEPHISLEGSQPSGDVVTSWGSTVGTEVQHFAYALTNEVHQRYYFRGGYGGWRHEVCTPGQAAPRSAVTSWYTSPEHTQHIAYVGDDRQVHETYFNVAVDGDDVWHHTVPSTGYRPTSDGLPPMTSWVTPDNVEHIVYLGDDSRLYELLREPA